MSALNVCFMLNCRFPIYMFINLFIAGSYRYNDHHFHYGYHISAAAIVAKYRPQWGVKYFERILLYVRDIANPSADDEFFPMYRQKDWYLGNSYAAGIVSSELLCIVSNSSHECNLIQISLLSLII